MSNWNIGGVPGCGGQPQYITTTHTGKTLPIGQQQPFYSNNSLPNIGMHVQGHNAPALVAAGDQESTAVLIDMRHGGEQVAHINRNGDHVTPVRSLSDYTRARISDAIEINGEWTFIWDLFVGMHGVKQVGRHITFSQDHSNALGLYIQRGGYAGMTAQEFVAKTVARVEAKAAKPVHMMYRPCGVKSIQSPQTGELNLVTCKRCRKTLRLSGT